MDEFYSIPRKNSENPCEKLSSEGFKNTQIRDARFTAEASFLNTLKESNLVEDLDSYSDYSSEYSYNITGIGLPESCFRDGNERHTLMDLPEGFDYSDDSNYDFKLSYPTMEIFEMKLLKYRKDYCIDWSFKNEQFFAIIGLYCDEKLSDICKKKNCLRFCCQPLNIFVEADSNNNESISGVSGTHRCESINDGDNILRLSNANFDFELAMEHISDNIPIYSIYDLPSCFTSEGYTTHDVKQQIYNKNGKFLVGTGSFDYENACISYSQNIHPESNISIYTTQIRLCKQTEFDQGYQYWVELVDIKIISSILILSAILLCALTIFDLINNRDKLFSALRVCVIFSYLVFYCVLCVVKFQVGVETNFPSLCIAEAVLIQFSYLSTICWLNTMCFDVWTKFRKMRVNNHMNRVSNNKKKASNGFKHPRFKWYALYSLGIPLIVSTVTIMIHFLPEELTTNVILPFKGIKKEQLIAAGESKWAERIEDSKSKCFFDDNLALLVYFHVITGPILFANLVLFLLFTWSLCCGLWAQSGPGVGLAIDRQSRNLKRVMIMFFTLGLPWLCDLIGFILMWVYQSHNQTFYIMKTILNVITASQGIIMFCSILFFDRRVLKNDCCGCKKDIKEDKPKTVSIEMTASNKHEKSPDPKKPLFAEKQKRKRQTPVMTAYKRKQLQ